MTTPPQETTLPADTVDGDEDDEEYVGDTTMEFDPYTEADESEVLDRDEDPETGDPEGVYEDITDAEAHDGRLLGENIDTGDDDDAGGET